MKKPKQISYVYPLPADSIKVQANALAMGCMATLRDFPNVLVKRDEIETQARAGCVTLKDSYTGVKGKQLTNDFTQFCELFIKQYVECYVSNAQGYELDQAFYLKNKNRVDEIGAAVAYHVLVEDYAAQLSGQKK